MDINFVVIGTGEWQRSIYVLLENKYGNERIWGVGPSLPNWFNYNFFICDVRDTSEIESHFRSMDGSFIFLTSQTDVAVPSVSSLNKTFGNNYVSPNITKFYTDKFQMRLLSEKSGFESIYFNKIDVTCIEEEVLSSRTKLVTKPLQLQSSIGVKLWDSQVNQKDLMEYVEFLNNRNIKYVIIEQFIEGDEYTVEGYKSIDKKHKILAISKKTKNCGFGIANDLVYSNNHLDTELYIKLSNILETFFSEYIFGPTHTEIIIKDSRVYLVEAAIRSGGSNIPSIIVPNMCGFNQELQLIYDVTGQASSQEVQKLDNVTVLSFFRINNQVIPNLSFDCNYVLSYWVAGSVGSKVSPVIDDRSRHGYVIFSIPISSKVSLPFVKNQLVHQNNGLIDFYD